VEQVVLFLTTAQSLAGVITPPTCSQDHRWSEISELDELQLIFQSLIGIHAPFWIMVQSFAGVTISLVNSGILRQQIGPFPPSLPALGQAVPLLPSQQAVIIHVLSWTMVQFPVGGAMNVAN
jgi:hypothetical protein